MYSIVLDSNIEDVRLEAEVSDHAGHLVAVIYEETDGWHVDSAHLTAGSTGLDLPPELVEKVKGDLRHYVNRTGQGWPDGLTKGGLALWLMEKDDGTAMGPAVRR